MTEPQPRSIIRLRRLLPATPQEVFDAWTNPESMQEWMCPGETIFTEVQLDVRVGGQLCIVMRSENSAVVHSGEYREIQRPKKLVFTWRSSATYEKETLVTVELLPYGDETELVLIHEWLPDALAIEKHSQGWRSVVDKFYTYLSR